MNNRSFMAKQVFFVASIWLLGIPVEWRLEAADWPQYRGANHDGISAETIRTNWAAEPPTPVWRVPLNPGLSSLSISGGRVFTLVRTPGSQPTTEYCLALNANTGAQLWATPVDQAYYPNGGVGDGSDDGPRSTPTVNGNRVYVLGSYLNLLCLDAASGNVIWSNNLSAAYGGSVIPWQNAASPVVESNLILVNCNAQNRRLLAVRTDDGSEVWSGQNDRMTQATPVAATIAGIRQVVFFAQSGLVSVAPASGAVLWRYPFSYNTSSAASPVVGSDVVYCSAAYGMGGGAVRITNSSGRLATNQVWRTPGDKMNHWATPVYHNGYLYGMYGQNLLRLSCVDLATGTEMWSSSGFGYGSTLLVNGLVLALSESGTLVLVRPNPTAYTEIARYRALNGSSSSIPGSGVRCWNVPAVSDGRIYVRSTTEAVCLDVAVAQPPQPLRLSGALQTVAGGAFQLSIGNENGAPLDPSRAARIDVFATTGLTASASNWIKLTNSAVLTDGQLRVTDSQVGTTPRRFFRVEERP